ncbi:trehalose-phosphatase [Candidatus Kaiserbacteria bacterium CG10_big_fil_rev_8_21_14_0_10_59_10]|uniref:Trehalose 6-phosphate phosphatase n=1 Tax=Candidatus Kaiserbacteria bacterium CG10_big_fil_rev_8_21_14_0_10_59_10 TaxID=1974612 RepID=A0A2H0U6Z8_9BACT|nr:MAG: trehalose-phosphatase [Candidatus Kaiserbacteria bacterium CG10_big_fil_rev_8_21_14_0_10_59_10]
MLSAARHIDEIARRVRRAGGALLFLDFDGTLAEIATTPESARMSARTRRALKACVARYRVAVISGRALADVRRKVGMRTVAYVGGHGTEYSIGRLRGVSGLPAALRASLRDAARRFLPLCKEYPGLRIERKPSSVSVHYRRLEPRALRSFARIARRLCTDIAAEGSLRIMFGKRVLEFMPAIGFGKGHAVGLLRRELDPRRTLPVIYIGDDTTDEEAFRALPREITVRVGVRRSSAARYVLRRRADVDLLLERLATL